MAAIESCTCQSTTVITDKNLSKDTIYSHFGANNRYFILIYHLDVILKVKYCFQGHMSQNFEPTSNLKLNPLVCFLVLKKLEYIGNCTYFPIN